MATTYLSPAKFWSYVFSTCSLFQDNAFEPGAISAVTPTAAGLGTVSVAAGSCPKDAWTVKALCTRGGELDDGLAPNVGPVPQFKISLNNGVSYNNLPLQADAAGLIKFPEGNFTLALQNGVTGAPVTIGSGNSSLIVTPKRAGVSLTILVGSALDHSDVYGAITLTVTASTTAAQAAAYFASVSRYFIYATVAAGGDGSGIVAAAAKTAIPFASFVQNGSYTFTTEPSPDIVLGIETAEAIADGYFALVWLLPLLAWRQDIELRVSELARWQLLTKRGMDRDQDVKRYDPEGKEGPGTMKWLRDVSIGQIRPRVTQSPTGALPFPDIEQPLDPLGMESGALPIG